MEVFVGFLLGVIFCVVVAGFVLVNWGSVESSNSRSYTYKDNLNIGDFRTDIGSKYM